MASRTAADIGTPRALRALLAIGLSIALLGCVPGPSGLPSGSGGRPHVESDAPTASEPSLAAALRAAIDPAAILADLERLQGIAAENGGTRAAGGESAAAAAELVAGALREAGYEVELQPVSVPFVRQDAPSTLEVVGAATAFEDLRDFKAMLLSASGDVTAPILALGFDPVAQPGARGGLGCDTADWAGFPVGAIALVQPGRCLRRDVIVNAQDAGAAAVLVSYPEWMRDTVLRPTLLNAADIAVPALGVTHDAGLALAAAAQAGSQVRVAVHMTIETRTSFNVIAETPAGDPAHVVMLGGHLDSTIDGPGINDNGSGTMTILEIARRLAAVGGAATSASPPWKVRVAFWTGEEIGLLGSAAYVRGLDAAAVAAIEAYLNFDMLGSPNGVRLIYDPSATSRPAEGATIAGLFSSAFDDAGLAWQLIGVGGNADHAPFDQAQIPTGGLFSGANEPKTAEQADLFGGTTGAPNDACYHLACDTVDNVDPVLLEEMARAAAWVVGELASGAVVLGGA